MESIIKTLVQLPLNGASDTQTIQKKAEWLRIASLATAVAMGIFALCSIASGTFPLFVLAEVAIGYAFFECSAVFNKITQLKFSPEEFKEELKKSACINYLLEHASVLRAIYNSRLKSQTPP